IDIRFDARTALMAFEDFARMRDDLRDAEVLARALGDQKRLGQIAALMVIQYTADGDYDGALRSGQEAVTIARALGDRSIEVIATSFLGFTLKSMGEFRGAATVLEPNVALEGDLRYERFGTAVIQSAFSQAWLSEALFELGRFDAAIGHAESAVRIAEEANHPYTLYFGMLSLGLALLQRGEFPRAIRVLQRCLDVARVWELVTRTAIVAAALGGAHALAGHADKALPLVVGAVEEIQRHQIRWPGFILRYAGMVCLSAGQIDEAAHHAQEVLAISRRRRYRALEAHALCLIGDVASIVGTGDAEGNYRQALALGAELGMRPLVAHCHKGLGKLHRRMGKHGQDQ